MRLRASEMCMRSVCTFFVCVLDFCIFSSSLSLWITRVPCKYTALFTVCITFVLNDHGRFRRVLKTFYLRLLTELLQHIVRAFRRIIDASASSWHHFWASISHFNFIFHAFRKSHQRNSFDLPFQVRVGVGVQVVGEAGVV